jgi:hypothetical protein
LFKPDGHLIHPAISLFKNRRMPIKGLSAMLLLHAGLAQENTGKMLDH